MASSATSAPDGDTPAISPPIWRSVLCAFCASLIGIGLARFAYTPLLPAVIKAHWFAPSSADYLGAANLAGYLAGALLGRPMARRFSLQFALRVMMLIATTAFFACGWPINFAWFFVWRFVAGVAGGVLMVLAAPAVLAHVPATRRGLAGGVIFMGIGIGVVASGTLVPLLLQQGLRQAWIGLGVISLLLTIIAWAGWPGEAFPDRHKGSHAQAPKPRRLHALYVEYALNAFGWVPHMIFLVDFVARGLHQGITVGSEYWILFGLGATFGPVLTGHIADRIGFSVALRLAFLIEVGAIAIPALGLGSAWLIASSIVVGAFVTGTVPLVLGRIAELLPHHPDEQKAAWSLATVYYAICQAGAAYGFSFLFAGTGGSYSMLFLLGAAAMAIALTTDLLAGFITREGERSVKQQQLMY